MMGPGCSKVRCWSHLVLSLMLPILWVHLEDVKTSLPVQRTVQAIIVAPATNTPISQQTGCVTGISRHAEALVQWHMPYYSNVQLIYESKQLTNAQKGISCPFTNDGHSRKEADTVNCNCAANSLDGWHHVHQQGRWRQGRKEASQTHLASLESTRSRPTGMRGGRPCTGRSGKPRRRFSSCCFKRAFSLALSGSSTPYETAEKKFWMSICVRGCRVPSCRMVLRPL